MRNTEQPMRVVSIKLPADLDRELTELARRRRSTRSAVVREALDVYAQKPRRSVTSAAGALVGTLKGAPTDLSVARKHLAEYGK
jgi:metal-responsive CopG/Arc/MetJ family transcriptional regulator